ncbi:MAG: Hpt domain-containing protein [Myxococcales bacterium]|nr:Hpt domain-containing protein [Myxococcales bacterium]
MGSHAAGGSTDFNSMAVLQDDDTGEVTREQLLELTDGDAEFAQELIPVFLADALLRLSEIETGLAAGDEMRVLRAAHTLKGAIAHFSLGSVYTKAGELEEAALTGDLAAVAKALPEARVEVEKLLDELKGLGSSL